MPKRNGSGPFGLQDWTKSFGSSDERCDLWALLQISVGWKLWKFFVLEPVHFLVSFFWITVNQLI